jgi:hypothetical protein
MPWRVAPVPVIESLALTNGKPMAYCFYVVFFDKQFLLDAIKTFEVNGLFYLVGKCHALKSK